MFEFNRYFIPNRAADVAESRTLHPGMQRFEDWVVRHRAELERMLA